MYFIAFLKIQKLAIHSIFGHRQFSTWQNSLDFYRIAVKSFQIWSQRLWKKGPLISLGSSWLCFSHLPPPTLFSNQCGKPISFPTTNTKSGIPWSFVRKRGATWMACWFLPLSFHLFRIPFLNSSLAFSPPIPSWSRLSLPCAVNLPWPTGILLRDISRLYWSRDSNPLPSEA